MDKQELMRVELGERVYLPKGRVGRVTCIDTRACEVTVDVEPRKPKLVRLPADEVERSPEELRVGYACVTFAPALAKAVADGEQWALAEVMHQVVMAATEMRDGLSPELRAKWDAGTL